MKMPGLELAKSRISRAKTVAIACHINPDGDAIGSLLSLGLGIESLGKKVYFISPDGIPAKYSCLPGAGRIKLEAPEAVDLSIAVDCSNKELLGSAFNVFRNSRHVLEIDHHEFRRPFGDTALIDKEAAAVGELIYILLKALRVRISKEIAQNLLTSIIVETNSFRLPKVRPLTFEICKQLLETKVDFHRLVEMVFWSKTKESALLSGMCMARSKFIREGRLIWSLIRKKDFSYANGKDEDVDNVADEMRSIQGVEIVVLFREKSRNQLRVSLRSKGRINIAGVAEHFKGGGHFDVAGCVIPNDHRSMKSLLFMAQALLSPP